MNCSSHVPARWKVPLKASVVALIAGLGLVRAAATAPPDSKKVDFVRDVQPIFKTACIKRHSLAPDKPREKASAGSRQRQGQPLLPAAQRSGHGEGRGR